MFALLGSAINWGLFAAVQNDWYCVSIVNTIPIVQTFIL